MTGVGSAEDGTVDWDFTEDFESYSLGRNLQNIDGWTVTNYADDRDTAFKIEESYAPAGGSKAVSTDPDDGLFQADAENTSLGPWSYPESGFELRAILSTEGDTNVPHVGVLGDQGGAGIEVDNHPYKGKSIRFSRFEDVDHIGPVNAENYHVRLVGDTNQTLTALVRPFGQDDGIEASVETDFTGDINGVYINTNNGGQIDSIRVRRLDGSETPTRTPSVSPTPVYGPSPTTTPPPTPTESPALAERYDLRGGDVTEVEPADETLYVISDVPNVSGPRIAVTTTDYELVGQPLVRDALYSYVWKDAVWPRDVAAEIERTTEFRASERSDRQFGHVVDAGWDITLMINLGLTLGPAAALSAAVDGILEEVEWITERVTQPYKKAFQSMSASVYDAWTIRDDVEDMVSHRDFSDTLTDFVGSAKQGYEAGGTAAQFYDDFVSALDDTGSLTSSSSSAIRGTGGFFAGLLASLAVDQIEGVVKAKTTIHSIGFAYASIRLPVLRELQRLKPDVAAGIATPGEILYYNRLLFTDQQMSAAAFQAVSEYWREISASTTGAVWDVVTDADGKAESAAELATTFRRTGRTVLHTFGAGVTTVTDLEADAINPTGGDQ